MKKQKRKYVVVRDHHDHRDHMYNASVPQDTPDVVDWRKGCSPIQNQDQLGCCTGFAIVGALEFDENKQRESFIKLSELFVYFNERDYEGDIDQDGGAQIRDGIKLIAKYGVCQESLWPYNEDKFKDRPSLECFQDGLLHRALAYKRVIVEPESFEHALAAGYPIVMGITVFASFESDEVAANGLVPMPQPGEECMGGHAVLAVGYDRKRRLVIVRNSWGADWGDQGYFYLPYEFMFGSGLVSDAWTVSAIS